MSTSTFSVTEYVRFGMLYLILCLRCRLQIIIVENYLIKLINLSLQCCCDCILVLFLSWAYISGYMPFMSSDCVHLVCSYSLTFACLLAGSADFKIGLIFPV